MKIVSKKMNRSHFEDSNLFVLEFLDIQEFDAYLHSLRYGAKQLPEPRIKEMLLALADKLEKRCDSRYTYGDSALSAALYPDEMAQLAMCLTGVLWLYEDFNKLMEDVFDCLEMPQNNDETIE